MMLIDVMRETRGGGEGDAADAADANRTSNQLNKSRLEPSKLLHARGKPSGENDAMDAADATDATDALPSLPPPPAILPAHPDPTLIIP